MRSTVLCCAIVAQSVALCHAQSIDQVIAPTQRLHDFGTVARAANTEHRFVLTNPYNTDLQISKHVRASCGCTTPIVETEVIKPGGTGTILARFNTGTFTGQKAATLTVSVVKPFFTELQLNVKGYIRSDVVLTPGEADFGNVPEGEAKSMEITLQYAGRSDWAILDVVSPYQFVKTEFAETERSAGRVSYKIKVDLDGSAPAGFHQNQLVLHTNDRRLTTLPMRLRGTVESPLQVSPQSLALGNVKPGEPIAQKMVLRGKEEFRILEITSQDAEIRFENDEKSKKAHLINIILAPQPNGREGEVKGHVLLKTDMSDKPLKLDLNYTIQTSQPASDPPAVVQVKK
ncbi:MAG: DUF1573 domain-containing protein [Pirellulaceae bacterium]